MTSSMEENSSWKADNLSASQEIPRVLWDLYESLPCSKAPPPPLAPYPEPVHDPNLPDDNPVHDPNLPDDNPLKYYHLIYI
jgi:hypothetical protein